MLPSTSKTAASLRQIPHELFTGLIHTFSVITVNHKDQTLCVLEVVTPQWLDLVPSTYILHSKVEILVLHHFHIEAFLVGMVVTILPSFVCTVW